MRIAQKEVGQLEPLIKDKKGGSAALLRNASALAVMQTGSALRQS
jgi:hypothetical protein